MLREFPLVRAHEAEKQDDIPVLFTGLDDEVFRDGEVERVVDTRGVSYKMARRIVDVPSRDSEVLDRGSHESEQVAEGISVDLGARALALTAIMKLYGQMNQTRGIEEHPDRLGQQGYKRPERVLDGMRKKSKRTNREIKKHVAILSGRTAFLATGMSPETIDWLETGIEDSLRKGWGPGNAYAPARNKLVRKVSKVPRKQGKLR